MPRVGDWLSAVLKGLSYYKYATDNWLIKRSSEEVKLLMPRVGDWLSAVLKGLSYKYATDNWLIKRSSEGFKLLCHRQLTD